MKSFRPMGAGVREFAKHKVCLLSGLLCVALLTGPLIGCSLGGGRLAKATPEQQAPDVVRMSLQPYVSNSVIKIGIEEGFFKAQGLDLEVVMPKGSGEVLALLATDEIDAGTPAMNPGLINAVAAGSGMRIVLPLTAHVEQECTTVAILARTEDIESGRFADPANWKGLRCMVTNSGIQGTTGYFLGRALAQMGLTLDDVTIQKAESAIHEEALRSGQVDLVMGLEPWITRATAQGDIGILMPIEPLVDALQSTSVVFSEATMNRPDVAQRFAVAYMQAVRRYAEGATPRNVEIVAEFTGLEPDLVRRMCWSYTPVDGHINGESLVNYQGWLLEQGLIDRVLPADEFIDTRFADEAVRILDAAIQ